MPPPDPSLVCQVIPDGREWPCTRRGNVSGEGEPILCTKHHNQYRKLTSKYQEHQQKAETAYPEVLGLLDHTERLKPLPTLHSVKEAFKVTDRCFSALREEISGREALQKRFFREGVWFARVVVFRAVLGLTMGGFALYWRSVDDAHRSRVEVLRDE